ncbi:hypothetical protein [Brevundimonas goettingensis]|jgi:hypothetical protein|uniref:Uncharacterized protein n=1 Tax=Brevundimonas goettingensis TaxID=2774190 RepID=A0A975GVB9_9CAUL|nr:hypothetical protein [Brevundimonas goettingensis]QTC90443.1 hypothetical protein IFJ75_14320 [Brevundimonas goettingensis]
MFVRFTTPEGARVYIRENRVQAFVSSEDGTRIFLSGSLSILVAEDDDEVRLILSGRPEDESSVP